MKCYNHNEKDAIAICKSCGKGLCKNCLSELTNGVACKSKCEERVKLINKIVSSNQKILTVSNKHLKNYGYISIVFGLIFSSLGVLFALSNVLFGVLFIILGITFIINGSIKLRKKSKYPIIENK